MRIGQEMGVRRFGRVNWLGLYTLIYREIRRFMSIWLQTIVAPLVNATLLMMIFNIAIGESRGAVMGVSFVIFIAPGVMMMTVIQNAFANSSSSLISAKIQGNIVDTLMPPLSAGELLIGYLSGALGRGILISTAMMVGMITLLGVKITYPFLALCFISLGSIFLGTLGIIAAIYANKFDQMSTITNFVITPLAFLSGSFYSIEALPEAVRQLAYYNPLFYLIDGTRYSILGISDSNPTTGFTALTCCVLAVCFWAWRMLNTGYRLKS